MMEAKLLRIDVLRAVASSTSEEDLFIWSLGGVRDDWWNVRPGKVDNSFHPGALGSISSTALGLALALPHRRVISLDTDGSVLMNLGVLCTLGSERPGNLTVVVLDNEVYESIGSPPTLTASGVDLAAVASGAGCPNAVTASDIDSFAAQFDKQVADDEFGFLVAKIEPGGPRWTEAEQATMDGVEDKYRFIRYVESIEGIEVHRTRPGRKP